MIQLDLANYATVAQQLALMQLTTAKLRKVLIKVGREALKDNKDRIKQQQKVTGSMFKPRSQKQIAKNKKLARKKMLIKLGQKLRFKNVTNTSVTLGWDGKSGNIAWKQQHGHSEHQTVNSLRSSPGSRNLSDPATSKQAQALLEAGYKAPRANGHGYKTVSKNWIKQNLTVGQAGAILRSMRGAGKQSWDIVLPARPGFGFADKDLQKYINLALTEIAP